ncbi:MAG TPA: type II toxin-antitoxin system VapC family toxin [Solirubrobacterales bacterium]|nr:type II toxin-antitoxin system VapC family toxin [Solirubrobacterales bacterium]
MKLLLDTHVWLWSFLDPDRLSTDARGALVRREGELFLSPISIWEALVLARKGRLSLSPSPREWILEALRKSAPVAVPLTHGVALRSEELDGFGSDDPADRFLVATALEHDLTLVTADGAMRSFLPVTTLW